MAYVLGVHDGHNATACLMRDGKILSCVSEERFNRIKNFVGMPKRAIDFVLSRENITASDLDVIVLGSYLINQPGHPSIGKEGKTSLLSIYRLVPFSIKKTIYNMPEGWFSTFDKMFSPRFFKASLKARKKTLAEILNVKPDQIISTDHHTLHAYTAYYGSGLGKDTLVITLDGEGDGICSSVNIIEDGKMKRIASTPTRSSPGLLYLEVTRFLGMKPNEHEYKVMGLAPYASEEGLNKSYKVFSDMISLDANNLSFKSKVYSRLFSQHLQEKLVFHRFDWIAGGIQKLTEDLTIGLIKKAIERTGLTKVVLAGGVFLNVKVNMKIMNLPEITDFFVFPSPGDESIAIGAVYYGYEKYCEEQNRKCNTEPLGPIYFGPEYSDEHIEDFIKQKRLKEKYSIEKISDIEGSIVDLMKNGEIVARMSERMEWGARALGNRSILADASNFNIIKTINFMIKMRDFWMPFAPTILNERQSDYIINDRKIDAPYMILAFQSKDLAKKDLAAAMHPYDETVRPQILKEDHNPSYYRILKLFESETSKGGILNTSFNLHGEPIVCNPEDALHTFENSGLKNLVIGNFLIRKK